MGALGYAFEGVALEPEIGTELYYSPEDFGNSGAATYVAAALGLSLPSDFGLNFSFGRQSFDDDSDFNYNDWKIALTRGIAGFDFEVAYTDTDLSKADCGDEDICDGRVVVSVSQTIE